MRTPAQIVDDLTSIDDLDVLDGYAESIVAQTRRRLDHDFDPLDVCAAIADSHEHLTRRLLDLTIEASGPPPCPYAWLLLGSHGRREQVPASDQDNAIVFQAEAGPQRAAAEEYFGDLATHVVNGLTRAGLPECDGGYMATRWCRPVEEYTELFRTWVDHPDPQTLVKADVFLDVVTFHGDLTVDRWDDLLLVGGGRGPFRAQMARAAVSFSPPLGLFGRVRAPEARVDVKSGGTAAIVLLARLYAFMAGSHRRSTVPRLAEAVLRGTLHGETGRDVSEAYRFLTHLRLRHQVDQVARGHRPDNRVRLDTLTPVERGRLRRSLRTVRDLQLVTAQTFATYTLT